MKGVYATRWFVRWAKKQRLSAESLCLAAAEMANGLYDAELGAGLVKKRVARPGQGKRGGFRTLVATNKRDRWVFLFGFAKNERDNIDQDEEEALKRLASHLLSLTVQGMDTAQRAGELIEVDCNAENEI
jgi:hypothetical protein